MNQLRLGCWQGASRPQRPAAEARTACRQWLHATCTTRHKSASSPGSGGHAFAPCKPTLPSTGARPPSRVSETWRCHATLDAAHVRAQSYRASAVIHHELGDAVAPLDGGVVLTVKQPTYQVVINYHVCGRVLETATRIWAHVGHSGWRDTVDVQLQRSQRDDSVWLGTYSLPTSSLVSASHVEVQLAFRGLLEGGAEQWDNNGGRNWQVVAELAQGEGVVLAGQKLQARALVSGLLLRLEALTVHGLLSREQGALLRNLAWRNDFGLLRAYAHEGMQGWDDAALARALIERCAFLQRPGVHSVHITSEMMPIAKVGGLGDVVTSLAKAHQATGTLVEVILPKYDCIAYGAVQQLRQLMEVPVSWAGKPVRTVVWSGVTDGLPVYFIEPYNGFFWRGAFYGQQDDAERFMFFSRAALEFLLASGKQPDVLHIHDWQSAAVAVLLAEEYRARGLTRPRTVCTIHNIAFQGWVSPNYLERAGLSRDVVFRPDRLLDDTRPGFHPGQHDANLLRGAVVYSDAVTTVSPNYAREVFDPEFGMGLQGVLATHRHKFTGVLNGIDHETWNPAEDWQLPAQFTADDCSGKQACKRALLQELGLPWQTINGHTITGEYVGCTRPLLAVVSRLTQQKGLPLILHGMQVAMARGAQVVVLGAASEPAVQAQWEAMARELGSGPDARIIMRFDEGLAHRIYAGADVILIPSFFEPCGLTQLIALRYGTIPVVSETGGLADTVRDVANDHVPLHERNGFVFEGREPQAVEHALNRCLDAYIHGHDWWKTELVPRGMRQDWSWSRSAQEYLTIYRQVAALVQQSWLQS